MNKQLDEYKDLGEQKPYLRDYLLQGPKFDDLDAERVRGERGKAREIDVVMASPCKGRGHPG